MTMVNQLAQADLGVGVDFKDLRYLTGYRNTIDRDIKKEGECAFFYIF